MSLLVLLVVVCAASALTIPPEKPGARAAGSGEAGNSRAMTLTSEQNSVGKSSAKFFGGLMPGMNPSQGFFPSPMGGYNMGGYPSYPYYPSTPYGYMNGPMNFGGYGGFPHGPAFYGNNFGGYAATQQQQQQQTSQMGGGGVGMGGFQPFGG